MRQLEKAKERLKSVPSNYTYDEARKLLKMLGYREYNKGRTSGSKVLFFRESDQAKLNLHKPHPQKEMKKYSVNDMKKFLEEKVIYDEKYFKV